MSAMKLMISYIFVFKIDEITKKHIKNIKWPPCISISDQ